MKNYVLILLYTQYKHIRQASSNQMFDFLNKLSHQHPKQQIHQQINENHYENESGQFNNNSQNSPQAQKILKNSNKKQKNRIDVAKPPRQISLSAQLQQGQKAELDPDVLLILEHMRDESERNFSQATLTMINQERAKVQRKVYLRQMSHNFEEYLQQILIQSSSPNRFLRHGIAQIIDHVAGSIYEDIMFTDKYTVVKKNPMTKDQLALLQKSISQIRNNEGNIRDKVGQLKLQLKNQSQKINDRTIQIMQKQSFSINHPKTKQVQQYLRSLQMQRQDRKMRQQQQRRRRMERKQQQELLLQSARQKAKSERHQRLTEAFEIKRRVKQQQVLESAKKNQEFKEWMKMYKKKQPLFKQKQKEYIQKFAIPQQNERMQKLMMRKQAYARIDSQEFEDHQQRYMEYKRDNALRLQAEKKMQKEFEKKRQKQLSKLHKGQFRYYILQQMVANKQKKDPKQDIIEKKIRQLAYSQNVKDMHRPKIDPIKKLQMENILNSGRRKKRYSSANRVGSMSLVESGGYNNSISYGDQQQQKDPRKEGQRMRRYLKQYLREKIEKGEVKKSQQDLRPATISPKQNYLQELRQNRQSTIKKAETIDYQINSIKSKQNVGALMARVQQSDSNAQRLEKKFKYAMHKPEQQAALEDNYLFSIKAKMQLLKNYD